MADRPADGARVRRRAPLPRGARRPGAVLRPAGQPPAEDRRHRAVPDRARLRAGGHRPRRRGQHRGYSGPVVVPAEGPGPVLVRRGQGAGREAGPDRAGGLLLPDLRERRTATRPTSAARTSTRCSRSTSTPATSTWTPARRSRSTCSTSRGRRRARQERPAAARSTWRRETPSSCRTGSAAVTFDEVVLLAADPDQPDAGQGDRAAGRGAGAARADGLAVHPLPPGVAARRPTGPDGTLVEVAALDRSGGGDRTPYCRDLVAELQEERADDRRRVGHAEQPGRRGRRRSSTSSPCSRTSSSGPRCGRSTASRSSSAAGGSEVGGSARRRPSVEQHRVRVAMFGRLASAAHRPGSGRPPARPGRARDERGPQPGARGATCTSSRSRARSWSRRSTSC